MRYKQVLVSGSLLVKLFTEKRIVFVRCIKGLPEGTKFCYCIPYSTYGIYIVVEHESFPELKDGDEIPILPPPEMETMTKEN